MCVQQPCFAGITEAKDFSRTYNVAGGFLRGPRADAKPTKHGRTKRSFMDTKSPTTSAAPVRATVDGVTVPILAAISLSHLLNDLIQSLIPAIYPVLKDAFHLDFGQIGLI